MKKARKVLSDLVDKLRPTPVPPVLAPTDKYPEPLPLPKDNACPTLKEEIKPPVFILLGQYRELIQMLPAFKAVHDCVGLKPKVIVSDTFAGLFEGVSYVEAHLVKVDWHAAMPFARSIAYELCGGVTFQKWNEGVAVEQEPSGAIILQASGHNWQVDTTKADNYGESMWLRAGFSVLDMLAFLPIVFDRRNPKREEYLLKQVNQGNRQKKPLFLYNFTGVQTMFGYTPEVQQALRSLNEKHWLVDLSKFKPDQVFDWLGVFEAATGMVTVDSYHLHLAAATRMPFFAFVEDGWNGSFAKGNVLLQTAYSDAKTYLPKLRDIIDEKFLT